MNIYGVQCYNCGDVIFSRARHDFHYCSCGKLGIDGGFNYMKISYDPVIKYNMVLFTLNVTKKELYDDWNKSKDKYGLMKCGMKG